MVKATRRRSRGTGQATIEMAVAFVGALLLLFGTLKVALWMGERYVRREINYERTRTTAAGTTTLPPNTNRVSPAAMNWNQFAWPEPAKQLNIFQ